MTRTFVSLISLISIALVTPIVNAELIKSVTVAIVTRPPDIKELRNDILKAQIAAKEALQEAEDRSVRLQSSRRPDSDILKNQASTATKLANEHYEQVKIQAVAEQLLQIAILKRVTIETINADKKSGPETQGKSQQTSTKLAEANDCLEHVEKQLKAIKDAAIRNRLSCWVKQIRAKKAKQVEVELRNWAEINRTRFLVEVRYGNKALKYVIWNKESISVDDMNDDGCCRHGLKSDLRVPLYKCSRLRNGEVLHEFSICLGNNGIPESTSDKAKVRIIKNYDRVPQQRAFGIWHVKDLLVTGYLDEKPPSRGEQSVYGPSIELLPLTIVRNEDTSILFSSEAEQRHVRGPKITREFAQPVEQHPKSKQDPKSKRSDPVPIHRIVYEWRLQNVVD